MLKALISHGTPTFMYDSAYKDECVNLMGLEPCPVSPAAAHLAAAHLAVIRLLDDSDPQHVISMLHVFSDTPLPK